MYWTFLHFIRALQLDVKKTAKGRITITTTTRGKTVLTTRKKEAVAAAVSAKRAFSANRAFAAATGGTIPGRPVAGAAAVRSRQIGNLTRRVGRGGQISLTTRDAGSALRPTAIAPRQVPAAAARRSAPVPAARFLDRDEEVFRPREEMFKPLTRTIKGTMSRAAQLDGRHTVAF